MNNILFVMSNLFYGGAEYQVRNIVKCCSTDHDLNISIVLEDINGITEDWEVEKFLEETRIDKTNIIHLNIGKKNILYSEMLFYAKLLKLLFRKKFDVVFIYNLHGMLAIPLFQVFRIKTIYSERNSGETTMRRWIYRMLIKSCNVITCNSDAAQNTIGKRLKRNVHKINNLVEIPNWRKPISDFAGKSGILTILIPARVNPIKNQKLVLDAMTISSYPCQFNIVLAGKTDNEHYLMMLQKDVEQLSNKGINVDFKGYVSDKEILYRACDVVILPSFSEGTPNVILESFARGIPVLASSISQNKALFENNKFLFDPNDVETLIRCIRRLMDMDKIELNFELERNFNFVVQNYVNDKSPKKYLNIVNELCF